MGVKMNAFGLIYNDKNTSSLGGSAEFQIITSNKSNKYHLHRCTYCGTTNRISLELVAEKLKEHNELIKKTLANKKISDYDKEMEIISGSSLTFYCGKCRLSIMIARGEFNKYELPNVKELNDEVGSYLTTLTKQVRRAGVNLPAELDKYATGGKK